MSYTKLNEVQVKIDETRQILTEDIDKLTDRGEKLHLLVDKTDRLSESVIKNVYFFKNCHIIDLISIIYSRSHSKYPVVIWQDQCILETFV